MKHISAVLLFITLSLPILRAQDTLQPADIYYTPPAPVTPAFEKPRFRVSDRNKLDDVKVLSRWYVGTDLYGRSDISFLDNNYRYLFKSNTASTVDFSFSGQVGWIFREQLAVEGGYARSAIHNTAVLNTTNKGGFRFANGGNAFFLRTKFLIEFSKMGLRRPGLWIGAGAWAVPNSGGERDPKGYIIYHYDYRGNSDTTYVSSKTTIGSDWTYGLEASAEYAFRLNEWSDMAFFLRRQWGYGTAVTTELTYADNKRVNDTGFIRSEGTGWSFGISLRFMTGIRRGQLNGAPPDEAGFSPYKSRIAQ